jgi:hypothetical protein
MNKLPKWKNALYISSAIVIIGLAANGIFRTADAANAAAENTVIINTSSMTSDPSADNGCSPYGCAGCTGCTTLQYQQNSEVVPSSQLEKTY